VDLVMLKKRRIRRRWEDGEKIRIVAQTRVPGVSVSQVARRYDVNANLVFKWLRDPRFNPPPEDGLNGSFLPVEVVAAAECAGQGLGHGVVDTVLAAL
jgi:transposase